MRTYRTKEMIDWGIANIDRFINSYGSKAKMSIYNEYVEKFKVSDTFYGFSNWMYRLNVKLKGKKPKKKKESLDDIINTSKYILFYSGNVIGFDSKADVSDFINKSYIIGFKLFKRVDVKVNIEIGGGDD